LFRIASIKLDGVGRQSPELEQEQRIAIYDLLEENHFEPKGSPGGPYHLILATAESRLVLDVRLHDGDAHGRVLLSMTPFRRDLLRRIARGGAAAPRGHRHGPPRPA
jgi:uncharacterized protein (UPF0262 family)